MSEKADFRLVFTALIRGARGTQPKEQRAKKSEIYRRLTL